MNEDLGRVLGRPVPEGSAVLWWLGQMGLLVKIGDTILCVDYFASPHPGRQTAPPVPMAEMEGITAFLGTHDHIDHIDHEAWKAFAKASPEAKFVFPEAHRAGVLADGIGAERCVGLNDGESCRIGGVTVRAVAAAHEFLDRDPVTGLYPCLQYVIEGGGVRIYHAGDSLRYEGMLPKLRAFGPTDAALLPINGRDGKRYRSDLIGNMTFQEAADLAGELDAGLVMPGHWDMFAGNTGDPEAFRDYVEAKYPDGPRAVIPRLMTPVEVCARRRRTDN